MAKNNTQPQWLVPAVLAGSAILLLAAILFTRFVLVQPTKQDPTAVKDDSMEIIQTVSRHVAVIATETPAVATVTNADQLRTQNSLFYRDAMDGDRLLVWSDKIVLYSTELGLILAVQPLPLKQPEAETTASATTTSSVQEPEEHVKIAVRNGSGKTGLGRHMAQVLTEAGLDVLPATNAKGVYTKTFIVVREGASYPNTIEKLIQLTGGDVLALPPAEGKLEADILVIVGIDSAQ